MENNDPSVNALFSEIERRTAKKPERGVKKRSGMNALDKVLPDVLSGLGLEKRLKEHALMQIWTTLLPESLAERSRPLFIDSQRNLVVAVSDASVAQELSLLKSKLIQALSKAGRSLGVELRALRIDMKNFRRLNEEIPPDLQVLPLPAEGELNSLDLSESDKKLIDELSRELSVSVEEPRISRQILRAFESQLRLAEWRRRNGYPLCPSCGSPVPRIYERGDNKVCFNCMLECAP